MKTGIFAGFGFWGAVILGGFWGWLGYCIFLAFGILMACRKA